MDDKQVTLNPHSFDWMKQIEW